MNIEKLPTRYFAGSASVQAGGTIVTPHDAAWAGNIWGDDLFFLPSQPMVPPVRIETVNADNTLTLAYAWPGAAATEEPYEIRYVGIIERSTAQTRRVLEELGEVSAYFDVQVNTLADRAAFDDRPTGFRVLVSDVGGGLAEIYSKVSSASADWSEGAALGAIGPEGPIGPIGITWRGLWSAATVYAARDGVLYNGSSWRAKQANTNQAPPTLPTVENAYWFLVSQAGTNGTGTGDVVGPASSVSGRIALFSGTTGKLLQQAGLLISDLEPARTLVTQAEAEAGTGTNIRGWTPQRVKQAIEALSPPSDMSALALEIADIKGGRFAFKGGIADPFDDETGVYLGIPGGLDSNTKLLLHFDGTNGATTFTDSAEPAKTVTRFGDTQITTSQSVFGGASALFDGTGDYLTVANSADWAFGTGSFTVDMRARVNTLAGGSKGLWGRTQDGSNYMDADISTTGVVRWAIVAGGSALMNLSSAAGEIVAGQWYALAFERSGNVFRIYKNGVIIASTTLSITFPAYSGGFEIGRNSGNNNQHFNGWLDEFRVSNIDRFAGAYTPATQAYSGPVGGSTNQVYDATNDLYRPAVTGGTPENMTLFSTSYPVSAQPTKARLVLQLDTSLTVVPGTDFTGEVSRDDGATWLLAPLTLASTLGTIKTFENTNIDLSSLPAGSIMRWRAKTLTNKNIAISGVVEQWS